MAQKQILIVCGEASGDLHAASLVEAIKNAAPGVKFSGVGGELLRATGTTLYCDIKGLSVIGLFDALKKLPKFFALRKLLLEKIRTEKPDCLILVDFSGFNLRLAKAVNKRIPVFYYVSPQVWASRPGRVRTIKKYVDKMLVLFKFEEQFYKTYGVNAHFVGHPLLDIASPQMTKEELLTNLKFSPAKPAVALLPGSRKGEIRRILPIMLKSAALINKEIPAQFVIAKASGVDWEIYNRLLEGKNLDVKIVEGKTYDCLNIADFSLVCSGTATLEAAIMQKPFAVVYKMSWLNYLLYRPQVKVPFIAMANIVAGRKIVPEFIQWQARPKKIAKAALKILKSPAESALMQEDLLQVKSLLGEKGACLRAAAIILRELSL